MTDYGSDFEKRFGGDFTGYVKYKAFIEKTAKDNNIPVPQAELVISNAIYNSLEAPVDKVNLVAKLEINSTSCQQRIEYLRRKKIFESREMKNQDSVVGSKSIKLKIRRVEYVLTDKGKDLSKKILKKLEYVLEDDR